MDEICVGETSHLSVRRTTEEGMNGRTGLWVCVSAVGDIMLCPSFSSLIVRWRWRLMPGKM